MKKYISRTITRLGIVLLISSIVLLLIAIITFNGVIIFSSLFLTIASMIAMSSVIRCPYCRAYFRGVHWSKPNAGYCNKCGKLMEYDDIDNQK